MTFIFKILCTCGALLLSVSIVHAQYKSDKVVAMYLQLNQRQSAAKLYSYKECFIIAGDSVQSINTEALNIYLKNLKDFNLFSEYYIKNEKKWIESIAKRMLKGEKIIIANTDKYYGSKKELVQEDLRDRQNAKPYLEPSSYYGSMIRGLKGSLNTTFPKAGYDMKYGISKVNDVWLIDWIREK